MADAIKTITVLGADGFIGKNLCARLRDAGCYNIVPVVRSSSANDMSAALGSADAVIHLAGVNRPKNDAEFKTDNVDLTEKLCTDVRDTYNSAPIIFASSVKAEEPTAYGRSKAAAEHILLTHAAETNGAVTILRLPNVFGKWCRPNYNSAVATFCHNIANDLPIVINDAAAPLHLVYIDDLCTHIVDVLTSGRRETGISSVAPVYTSTVGQIADAVRRFHSDRTRGHVGAVGSGLERALYATYLSYLKPAHFSAPLAKHEDARGWFSEFVKTETSGQVSIFTAHPGITRGGHYHHTKTEKFLVLQGKALFRFRCVVTNETYEIRTDGTQPTVVETVPGWSHSVTNIGESQLICVLWANELFDPQKPDTIAHKV